MDRFPLFKRKRLVGDRHELIDPTFEMHLDAPILFILNYLHLRFT